MISCQVLYLAKAFIREGPRAFLPRTVNLLISRLPLSIKTPDISGGRKARVPNALGFGLAPAFNCPHTGVAVHPRFQREELVHVRISG
jgi:hypothetical protein